MNRLDRRVPHLFENPRIIPLANQLHDVGHHDNTKDADLLVAWFEMTKKGWVRKDRDLKKFCLLKLFGRGKT
jgi:hypothetical protein